MTRCPSYVRTFPRTLAFAAAAAALGLAPRRALLAQDRLVGATAIGAGLTTDFVQFGKGGYLQPDNTGIDSVRLRSISQWSAPISLAIPIGLDWTIDVQTLYSQATVNIDPYRTGARQSLTLRGISDVRIRTTGRLFGDAVAVTAGVNLPSGRTQLSSDQLTVLRAVAAPALGLGAPSVGAGPSGTMGLVFAREINGWAVAWSGSYELRGEYQPVAALIAGAPSTEYEPGNVVRSSIGVDGLVGRHRLSVSASADVYADDRLRDMVPGAANPNAPGGDVPSPTTQLSTVRLGPVLSFDAQMQLAVPKVRELMVWSSGRVRSRYRREGESVEGTNGFYLDGGMRTSVPLTRALDALITVDARWNTGLAIAQGIATAGVTSGGGTLGLVARRGQYSLQPYVRLQTGQLTTRGSGNAGSTSFIGQAAGVVFTTRF